MSNEGSPKAVIAALTANLGIALTKFLAWLVTGASSMLAEAVHSLADSGNQLLLLVGGRRSRKRATAEHPFGYGRERYVFAFVVSIVLFTIGGVFALYEAYHKYQEVTSGHANELLTSRWWWVPLVVLVAAIAMEGASFRTAFKQATPGRRGLSWVGYIRQTRSPELPVVLLEDLAALLGLAFALIGIGATLLTDNGYWDAGGTAAIGLLLVTVAIVLAVETKSLLIGESATPRELAKIEDALADDPAVLEIINLRTMHLGPDELLVASKIAVHATESGAEIARVINEAETRIRDVVPYAEHIYIEPDMRGPAGR